MMRRSYTYEHHLAADVDVHSIGPGHVDVDLTLNPDHAWSPRLKINEYGSDTQVCVWVRTEGSDGLMPWACMNRREGFYCGTQMIGNRIAAHVSITGCSCAANPDSQCVFDTFADDERAREVLTQAAAKANFGPECPAYLTA